VLAVFGPYNFPGHLPNGHIVPALLAGNTGFTVSSAVQGVNSLGLNTTVLPASNAGTICPFGRMIGKVAISIRAYHQRTGESSTEMADGVASLRHRPHGLLVSWLMTSAKCFLFSSSKAANFSTIATRSASGKVTRQRRNI
jgi:hypothetical protein